MWKCGSPTAVHCTRRSESSMVTYNTTAEIGFVQLDSERSRLITDTYAHLDRQPDSQSLMSHTTQPTVHTGRDDESSTSHTEEK